MYIILIFFAFVFGVLFIVTLISPKLIKQIKEHKITRRKMLSSSGLFALIFLILSVFASPNSTSAPTTQPAPISASQEILNTTTQDSLDNVNEAFKELYGTASGRAILEQQFSKAQMRDDAIKLGLDPTLVK